MGPGFILDVQPPVTQNFKKQKNMLNILKQDQSGH